MEYQWGYVFSWREAIAKTTQLLLHLTYLQTLDVLKAADLIRLSSSVAGSKGQIWSEIPNPYEEWEVIMQIKVLGQHVSGGRGMAFWYAKDRNQDGPIYGSKDKWKGLGVWLDSSNPKVSVRSCSRSLCSNDSRYTHLRPRQNHP